MNRREVLGLGFSMLSLPAVPLLVGCERFVGQAPQEETLEHSDLINLHTPLNAKRGIAPHFLKDGVLASDYIPADNKSYRINHVMPHVTGGIVRFDPSMGEVIMSFDLNPRRNLDGLDRDMKANDNSVALYLLDNANQSPPESIKNLEEDPSDEFVLGGKIQGQTKDRRLVRFENILEGRGYMFLYHSNFLGSIPSGGPNDPDIGIEWQTILFGSNLQGLPSSSGKT